MSGDTIEIWTDDKHLDRVVVLGSAPWTTRQPADRRWARPASLPGSASTSTSPTTTSTVWSRWGRRATKTGAVPRPGKTQDQNLAEGDTITVFFVKRKIDVRGSKAGVGRVSVRGRPRGHAKDAEEVATTQPHRVPGSGTASSSIRGRTSRTGARVQRPRVEFDLDKQSLVAKGKPELIESGDRVTGHLMTYNLESRVGNIYKAETTYEAGLYHGERIRKPNDNELDILNGSYSTCTTDQPHYHFSARYMKIFLKDKLIAKPVVFYIKRVPLLALPFWVFPIKPGRHSGLLFPQFELGFSSAAGQFIRNAGYYYAPNDYMDFTVSGDYYQAEPSWVVRPRASTGCYTCSTARCGSYARNEAVTEENWDFEADHSHELTPRTRMVARASFVSSRDYNSSNLFGRSLSQRLNRFLTSSVAMTHGAEWASFNGFVERRQDLDADLDLEDPDGPGPLRSKTPGPARRRTTSRRAFRACRCRSRRAPRGRTACCAARHSRRRSAPCT